MKFLRNVLLFVWVICSTAFFLRFFVTMRFAPYIHEWYVWIVLLLMICIAIIIILSPFAFYDMWKKKRDSKDKYVT